jgi:hypothetical protein
VDLNISGSIGNEELAMKKFAPLDSALNWERGSEMKYICVFCGSSTGNRPAYKQAAQAMGEAIARRGLGLVYGGGNIGLMGMVADATLAAGGEVIGVIPRFLVDKEISHDGLTQLHVVDSMHDRKALMAELANAFIAG